MENENINIPAAAAAAETSVPQPAEPVNLPNPPSEGGQNPPSPLYQGGIIGLLQKAKEKIQFRKRAKLEKIMALAQTKSTAEAGQGKITNNDTQKLLRVSDATATRYLSELVKQGRLKRVGPANNAFYQIAG